MAVPQRELSLPETIFTSLVIDKSTFSEAKVLKDFLCLLKGFTLLQGLGSWQESNENIMLPFLSSVSWRGAGVRRVKWNEDGVIVSWVNVFFVL